MKTGLFLPALAVLMMTAGFGLMGCKLDTTHQFRLPENPGATALSAAIVELTWTAPADGGKPDGYNVYRLVSTVEGSSTYIGTTSNTSYTDTTVDAGSSYYYHVAAYNKAGEGQWVSFPLVTTPR